MVLFDQSCGSMAISMAPTLTVHVGPAKFGPRLQRCALARGPCGPGSHGGAEPPAEHRFGIASRWQIRARSVARATVADLCAGRRDQRDASISFPVRHRALRARSGRREPAQGSVRLGGRVRARRAHGISRRSCSQQWPGPPCWLSGHLPPRAAPAVRSTLVNRC